MGAAAIEIKTDNNKPMIIWLITGCLLIFAMVFIGGITRLTGSGLSITEWKVIMGAIPPSNDAEWNEAFDKYKQIPQFQLVNNNFKLEDFKQIFFWEWFHRLIGRLVGVVFIIPYLWFLFKKKIDAPLNKKLLMIFSMGAFQGFLGWYMVSSGLSELTSVSHYRLAMHLITAFLTCAYIFWVALDLWKARIPRIKSKALLYARITFSVLILQIIYGAFVAGLDAGLIYNTWPKMNAEWFASNAFSLDPFYLNLIEHKDGIQLMHRYLAYLVTALAILLFIQSKKSENDLVRKGGILVLIIVLLQFLLGVLTLVMQVPISIALMHQCGAFLLLMSLVYYIHTLKLKN